MIVSYTGDIAKAIKNNPMTIEELIAFTGIRRERVITTLHSMLRSRRYEVKRDNDKWELVGLNKPRRRHIRLPGSTPKA